MVCIVKFLWKKFFPLFLKPSLLNQNKLKSSQLFPDLITLFKSSSLYEYNTPQMFSLFSELL